MSTKTSLKRIALVAVSALGLGLLSVVPAKAANEYLATYSAPTALTVLPGYDTTTVGTVQVDMAITGAALTAGDTATVTISAATAGDTEDVALLAKLRFSNANAAGASSYDTAVTGYNVLNNGTLSTSATTVTNAVTAAGGRASVKAYMILDPGLTATLSGGIVKYTLTATSARGIVNTFTTYLTVTVSNNAAGTITYSPVAQTNTVLPGATTTAMTMTVPYASVPANNAWTDRTFTNTGTAANSTFNITATVTGGSVTLVRVDANNVRADAVKNGIAGAFSVVYTITHTAAATAAAGETIVVGGFTTTVQPTTPVYTSSTLALTVSNTGYYQALGDATLYSSASATAGKAATITVTQKDQTAASITMPAYAKTVVATITGEGSLESATGGSAVKTKVWSVAGGTLTSGNSAVASVEVYPTGTAGTGTLSISVDGVAVKSYPIKFYGDAAKITATLLRPVGSTAGATAGVEGSTTVVSGNIKTVAPAIGSAACGVNAGLTAVKVVVEDANGVAIPTTTAPTAVSSNRAVVSGSSRMFIDSGISDVSCLETSAGTFAQHYDYTTVAGAASGSKSSLTYTFVNAAGTTLVSNAVEVAVGGAIATWTLVLDKASYNPGEVATLTVTAKDSAGNAAYDGQDAVIGGFESTLGFDAPSSMKIKSGTTSSEVFAPLATGTWTITAYDALGGSKTATATVVNVSAEAKAAANAATEAANAAGDAAAEAIDAANAATDAANLAAEAADAATVAAEEARDAADAATAAVEELATQVATLMAALKAQITTLANTVAKIAKKVKA